MTVGKTWKKVALISITAGKASPNHGSRQPTAAQLTPRTTTMNVPRVCACGEGRAIVSLVVFEMRQFRPRWGGWLTEWLALPVSKNRFFNLVDQGLNGMISFTNAPMRLAIFTGFGMAALSLAYSLVQLIANLLDPNAAPPGIATLIDNGQ